MIFSELLTQLDTLDAGIIQELANDYYETPNAFMTAIVDEDDELSDKISEYADGNVSTYTKDVYDWINDNYSLVQTYEQDAISEYGATTVEKIGQVCQYLAYQEYANDAINEARKILTK